MLMFKVSFSLFSNINKSDFDWVLYMHQSSGIYSTEEGNSNVTMPYFIPPLLPWVRLLRVEGLQYKYRAKGVKVQK